ncbi:MAG: glycosyltransferase [Lachnospiraceae bacterium]|nr:glycosyltransferase [Lachnospiraceae bacterium]
MKLSVVLPAYKEADNLKKILPEIHNQVSLLDIDYEILVVDTMENMDDTEEVCKLNGATYLHRKNGNLYGDAIRTGINQASGNYILMMDADGSHEPKGIKNLYKEIVKGNYDIVIGSRYCKGGKTDNSFILKSMSYVLNVTYKVIFGLNVRDCSNSFRIYNSDILKKIKLECDNFDIVEEILIKINSKNIKEVPIYFKKRDEGTSKRDLVKFIFSYLKTIIRLLKIKNNINCENEE